MPLDTYNPVREGEWAGQADENACEIESLNNKQLCTGLQNTEN